MGLKISCYNKNFQMSKQGVEHKDIACKVRSHNASFKTSLGLLVFNGEVLEKTYVLEIHYKNSKDAHAKTLPLNGFASQLCYDYAEEAHRLASQLCEEKNLVINNHLNSWPEFQAIVSKRYN